MGGVEKEEYLKQNGLNIVVDKITGEPIRNAQVSIPSKGVFVRTNGDGYFSLDVDLQGPAILSVKADGYKPFSLTISKDSFDNPLIVGISKQSANELVIDSSLHHLGDDNFSSASANAGDFKLNSKGSYFSKAFISVY
jgi:NDP-sugar pyrophosphorylase family protein